MSDAAPLVLFLLVFVTAGSVILFYGAFGRRPVWAQIASIILGWALIVTSFATFAGLGGWTNPQTFLEDASKMPHYLQGVLLAFFVTPLLLLSGTVASLLKMFRPNPSEDDN